MNSIYLDNAATTRMDGEVLRAIVTTERNCFGNPSSAHAIGMASRRLLDEARAGFLEMINGDGRILFTSGGTESDNLAILGAGSSRPRRRLVVSAIEHAAVYETAMAMRPRGYKVTEVPVASNGVVDVRDLMAQVGEETALVSLMHANNEIGALQPVREVGRALKSISEDIIFHVDAAQSFTKTEVDVRDARIDLLSLSSHKIHGPKGVGLLYARDGLKLSPILFGGGQEYGLRSGTENVPAIFGFYLAAQEALERKDEYVAGMVALRDRLLHGLRRHLPQVELNADMNSSVCHILNLTFKGIPAEVVVNALSEKGLMASTGSACHAHRGGESRVLQAIGRGDPWGGVRFSLSRYTTEEEIERGREIITDVVHRLSRVYRHV